MHGLPEPDLAGQEPAPAEAAKPSEFDISAWRAIPVHSAALLFPMMSDSELVELGEDMRKHGLQEDLVSYVDEQQKEWRLDGRNREAAMAGAGLDHLIRWRQVRNVDPIAFVISANIQRRHLTAEQKRELIKK